MPPPTKSLDAEKCLNLSNAMWQHARNVHDALYAAAKALGERGDMAGGQKLLDLADTAHSIGRAWTELLHEPLADIVDPNRHQKPSPAPGEKKKRKRTKPATQTEPTR